jgi:hypothetical protein
MILRDDLDYSMDEPPLMYKTNFKNVKMENPGLDIQKI